MVESRWYTSYYNVFFFIITSLFLYREVVTLLVLLLPATKLGQGYIFTGIHDSVHGGVSSVHAGIPPHTPPPPARQTTPGKADPLARNPPLRSAC